MANTKSVSIRIDEQTLEDFDLLAEIAKTDRSKLIIESMESLIEKNKLVITKYKIQKKEQEEWKIVK